MPRTATQQLLDHLLGEPVEDWIRTRRASSDPPRSWRLIARDIYEATEHRVDVTGERLRRWLEEPEQQSAPPTTKAG